MSGSSKFTLVEDTPAFAPQVDAATQASDAKAATATAMMMLALRALSARAAAAISDLFSLFLVGAVCALAYHILDNPTQLQIITVFGFAGFCVVIDIIRRKTK